MQLVCIGHLFIFFLINSPSGRNPAPIIHNIVAVDDWGDVITNNTPLSALSTEEQLNEAKEVLLYKHSICKNIEQQVCLGRLILIFVIEGTFTILCIFHIALHICCV